MKSLPLSTVAFVFGLLSMPMAFLRHLCVPAVIIGVLALVFFALGRWRFHDTGGYSDRSYRIMKTGAVMAVIGSVAALVMWQLYATGHLL